MGVDEGKHYQYRSKDQKIRGERLANEIAMHKHGKRLDEIKHSGEKDRIYKTGMAYTDKALNKYLRGE